MLSIGRIVASTITPSARVNSSVLRFCTIQNPLAAAGGVSERAPHVHTMHMHAARSPVPVPWTMLLTPAHVLRYDDGVQG